MSSIHSRTPWIHLAQRLTLLCSVAACLFSRSLDAQVTLASAVSQAIHNSKQIQLAQDDLNKAHAISQEMKDYYIPSVAIAGGVGAMHGIMITVPTVFTITSQSIIYNASQLSEIKAAELDEKTARLALADARSQTEADVISTYISLSIGEQMKAANAEASAIVAKLEAIMKQRADSGLADKQQINDISRAVLQTQLQTLQQDDQLSSLRDHLAHLTGIPPDQIHTLEHSVPSFRSLDSANGTSPVEQPDDLTISSANARVAAAKMRARADAQYVWRPQVTFAAQYARISPINNVSSFYNLNGEYNTASVGVGLQLPLFDFVRRQKAHESAIDAVHAEHSATSLRDQMQEDHRKLLRSLSELRIKARLAALDYASAKDRIDAVSSRAKTGGFDGVAPTPLDVENASLDERRRYIDLLDATLQLHLSEIIFLRQSNQLNTWLAEALDKSN